MNNRYSSSTQGANSAMLSEESFEGALRGECRRTERSGRPFLLMLASLERISGDEDGRACLEVLAVSMAASGRETDIVGWYRQGKVLGAIFTELGAGDKNAVAALVKERVSATVDQHSIGKNRKQIKLSFHFFPEQDPHSPPWLHQELHRTRDARTRARAIKRTIDIAGSLLGLAILSPLLLLIGALIKLTSPGPVLYSQTRVGQHGKEFTFLKFRSMYVNSDAAVHKEYVTHFIAGKAPMKQPSNRKSGAYKVVDDPRITPLGRILRKTSLDELPQLLNVLNGEMSLVGPRPPLPYECACYDVWHLRRIVEVKPGITGLWQVCGRSRTSFDDMVRLDLRYAKRWSLSLDLIILLRTLPAVFSGNGAY